MRRPVFTFGFTHATVMLTQRYGRLFSGGLQRQSSLHHIDDMGLASVFFSRQAHIDPNNQAILTPMKGQFVNIAIGKAVSQCNF
uniref:2-oxoacid_dh domain-containing protein n=1 Tax=Panagrellus redivivus TaxID=6233 RepID=A0A7E4VRD5_PANRE